MGPQSLLVLVLIGYAAAAPWRCYRACDGSTICIGNAGQPSIAPPSICIGRCIPPCVGSTTVYTPGCPCPPPLPPCPPPPCPPPPCPPPPCEMPCPCPCPCPEPSPCPSPCY